MKERKKEKKEEEYRFPRRIKWVINIKFLIKETGRIICSLETADREEEVVRFALPEIVRPIRSSCVNQLSKGEPLIA